jgi:hypothetical protein
MDHGFTLSYDPQNEDARMQSLRILARLIARKIDEERLAEERKESHTMAQSDDGAGRAS